MIDQSEFDARRFPRIAAQASVLVLAAALSACASKTTKPGDGGPQSSLSAGSQSENSGSAATSRSTESAATGAGGGDRSGVDGATGDPFSGLVTRYRGNEEDHLAGAGVTNADGSMAGGQDGDDAADGPGPGARDAGDETAADADAAGGAGGTDAGDVDRSTVAAGAGAAGVAGAADAAEGARNVYEEGYDPSTYDPVTAAIARDLEERERRGDSHKGGSASAGAATAAEGAAGAGQTGAAGGAGGGQAGDAAGAGTASAGGADGEPVPGSDPVRDALRRAEEARARAAEGGAADTQALGQGPVAGPGAGGDVRSGTAVREPVPGDSGTGVADALRRAEEARSGDGVAGEDRQGPVAGDGAPSRPGQAGTGVREADRTDGSPVADALDRAEAQAEAAARRGRVETAANDVLVEEGEKLQTLDGMLPLALTMDERGLFDFDRYELRSDVKSTLDLLAEKLKGAAYDKLHILGYTDRIGTEEYNQKLSEKRAWAVAGYLMNKGVPPYKLRVVGRGEAESLVGDEACDGLQRQQLIECLQRDRRVEIAATVKEYQLEVR